MAKTKPVKAAATDTPAEDAYKFERVAKLNTEIKLAQRNMDIRKAAYDETRNQVKKLQKELFAMIDTESDPTPHLFSHLTPPSVNGDAAAKKDAPPLEAVGDPAWRDANISGLKDLNPKDVEALARNDIDTVGKLADAKAAGWKGKDLTKATIERAGKALQKFLVKGQAERTGKAKRKGKAAADKPTAGEPAAAGGDPSPAEAQ